MITPDPTSDTPVETQNQYFQRLAADMNTFNQVAMFCGMATANSTTPAVQLTLGNMHRTTIMLNSLTILPALSAEGKRLMDSLQARGIDTDELMRDVSKSLTILTTQKGG